jgi:hypothetical protein
MNPLILGPIIDIAKSVIDRVIPDHEGRAKAKQAFELEVLKRRQEIIQATQASDAGQVEINKVEAAAPDLFRGGWRPFVGWVCGFAVAYQFLGRPILTWATPLLVVSDIPPPPALDMADLIFLLGGMLGLGTLRTVEKKSGLP